MESGLSLKLPLLLLIIPAPAAFRARTLAASFLAGLSSPSTTLPIPEEEEGEGLVTVRGGWRRMAPLRPTVLPLPALSNVRKLLALLRTLALSPRVGVLLPVPVPVRLEPAPVPVVVEDTVDTVEWVDADDPVVGRFRVSTLALMDEASESASIREVWGWCDVGLSPMPDFRPLPVTRPGLFRVWVPDGWDGLGLRRSSMGTSMSAT